MAPKKWKSPQALIVLALIVLIFVYIGYDALSAKPKLEKDIVEVKNQYVELSSYIEAKIPEIDSTFKEHAEQIEQTKLSMNDLRKTFNGFKE